MNSSVNMTIIVLIERGMNILHLNNLTFWVRWWLPAIAKPFLYPTLRGSREIQGKSMGPSICQDCAKQCVSQEEFLLLDLCVHCISAIGFCHMHAITASLMYRATGCVLIQGDNSGCIIPPVDNRTKDAF